MRRRIEKFVRMAFKELLYMIFGEGFIELVKRTAILALEDFIKREVHNKFFGWLEKKMIDDIVYEIIEINWELGFDPDDFETLDEALAAGLG